jgi:hypothetical protein
MMPFIWMKNPWEGDKQNAVTGYVILDNNETLIRDLVSIIQYPASSNQYLAL